MIIYPAVDLLDGKCVRLREGNKENATVYYEDAVEAAKMWADKGAERLHVIDLNGAFSGSMANRETIEKIIKAVKIPVQVGGGLRSITAVKEALELGAARVIIGTAAVMEEELLEEGYSQFPDKFAVSIDAREGFVAINGWVNISELSAYNFAKKIVEKGLKNIIYTDISRDGTLRGPNLDGVEKMCNVEGAKIIASGGAKSLEDLKALKAIGVEGVIIGTALYTGAIKLEEALKV